MVGESRDCSEGSLRTCPPDHDRGVGPLEGFRCARCIDQTEELALEATHLSGEQPSDDVAAFLEAVETLTQWRQIDAVGCAFVGGPSGTETQIESPIADDVEGCGHLGEYRRVPVDHRAHQETDT